MGLRLGLVGRGRWGRNIERTLLSFPDVSVTTVGKGERLPAGLDGVLIATPSATHADVALPYIESGIATFIEKPMTTTVSDAERIGAAAVCSGAAVFVGHIFLHNPAFLATLELLPALGDIRYWLCEGLNNSPRMDSSVLWDFLPHDLSMARAVFGQDPDSVAAWNLSGNPRSEAAICKFNFGFISVISTISWQSPFHRKRITLVGDKATLVFDDKAEHRLVLYGQSGERTFPAYSDALPLTCEMEAFLQTVRSGRADASQIELGSAVVRAIAGAERSMGVGGQLVMLK